MSIVFACAASHAPGITAWTQAAPKEQADRVLGAYKTLGERLASTKPDALVLITVEHWANFFLDHMPGFCLGRAEHFEGPVEEWLKIPRARIPGEPGLAARLLEACYGAGFEPSFSDELQLDHATMLPLHFLTPEMKVPIVPLIVNALTPPMPTAKRCLELGAVMGKYLEADKRRIGLIATGGLSHWPGEPKAGKIDTEFDREFLKSLSAGDLQRLGAYRHEEIADAGSGAHEVRTWIALAGAVAGWKAKVLAYEPVAPWATGCGLAAFTRS